MVTERADLADCGCNEQGSAARTSRRGCNQANYLLGGQKKEKPHHAVQEPFHPERYLLERAEWNLFLLLLQLSKNRQVSLMGPCSRKS